MEKKKKYIETTLQGNGIGSVLFSGVFGLVNHDKTGDYNWHLMKEKMQ